MFANFFGIVIISASILMIAGLVLRPTPDLPASMNLGIVKAMSEATQQASTVDTSSTAESNAETSSASDANTETTSTETTATEASSDTETASSEAATDTDSDTKANDSSQAATAEGTEAKAVVTEVKDDVAAETKAAVEAETPESARAAALRKRNLEIRRRAAEASGSGTVRINKSDIGRTKN
jgi:hypothetical protein